MTTIKKVANIAGVSIATVSRFLNNPDTVSNGTRLKVEKAITKTNFVPSSSAKNLRRGKTGLIIVAIPRIGDAFYDGIVKSVSQRAMVHGFNILVKETSFDAFRLEDYLGMITSKQTDGIILCVGLPGKIKKTLKPKKGLPWPPIVLACEPCGQNNTDFSLPSVMIDNFAAAKEATGYLIGLGHKRVAYVNGYADSPADKYRESGYLEGMAEHELIQYRQIIKGGHTLEAAKQATQHILELEPRPSAVFCGNDEMAIGILHQLKISNVKVPEDISIIGFDDIRYAEMTTPPLTTISQPNDNIGAKTMDILNDIIAGSYPSYQNEVLSHKLVIRQSTAPPHVNK